MRSNINPNQISLFDAAENRSALRERERERERERWLRHNYNNIISPDNLLTAWREFLNGKKKRSDVAKFSLHLTDNILELHRDLENKSYKHGEYYAFKINDPKHRDIHKATVRDRLLHHALYRILYPYFAKIFISDSYSCQRSKGTHRAINQFRKYARKVSRNNTKTAWVLKGDIRKFFANINHTILKRILRKHIEDQDIMWLLEEIIDSFHTDSNYQVGLPLGNLTSQIFINIYMNKFDQFIKHKFRIKFYVRYADDFVVISQEKAYLENLVPEISKFLGEELRLTLHPDKLFIKTLASGIDFLGWIHFPHYRILRTSTKRRMLNKLKQKRTKESIDSYLGLLKHGNTYKLQRVIKKNKED